MEEEEKRREVSVPRRLKTAPNYASAQLVVERVGELPAHTVKPNATIAASWKGSTFIGGSYTAAAALKEP